MARFLADGKKQLEQKDYARAILQFKNAVQARPKQAEPWYQLALANQAAGDLRAAVACLRKATELNPKHAEAQLRLAGLMTMAGSKEVVEEGRNRALQVLSTAPDNPEALDTLAVAELRLGEPAKAEEHLREALGKFPQHLQSSVALARLKLSKKDLAGAEHLIQHKRQRPDLLTGGTRRAPDIDRLAFGEPGRQFLAQKVEVVGFAQERGVVGRQRVNHGDQRLAGRLPENVAIVVLKGPESAAAHQPP